MGKGGSLGKILCFFGIHKWGKKYGYDIHMSNVIDWKKDVNAAERLRNGLKQSQKIMDIVDPNSEKSVKPSPARTPSPLHPEDPARTGRSQRSRLQSRGRTATCRAWTGARAPG